MAKRSDQLKQRLEDFFKNNPHFGTPSNISQAGCIALVQQGRLLWNYWRKQYPCTIESQSVSPQTHITETSPEENYTRFIPKQGVSTFSYKNNVNFEGVDFSQIKDLHNQPISFAGFKFDDAANFEDATFPDKFNFSRAQFGVGCCFDGIHALGDITFFDAVFKGNTTFKKARFDGMTSFKSALFYHVSFDNTHWGIDGFKSTLFRDCIFTGATSFNNNCWFGELNFLNAQFLESASFKDCEFKRFSSFSGTQSLHALSFNSSIFHQFTRFDDRSNKKVVYLQSYQYRKDNFLSPTQRWQTPVARNALRYKSNMDALGLSSDQLHSVYFNNAIFHGGFSFRNRKVSHSASWAGATFHRDPPYFFDCQLPQDTTFDSAKFPKPTGNELFERAYRTLKIIQTKHNNPREEQSFFRLEMLEEMEKFKKSANWRGYLTLKMYQCTADFGLSSVRPLLAILVLLLFFIIISACLFWCQFWIDHKSIWIDHNHKSFDWLHIWDFFRYHFSVASPFSFFDKDLKSLRDQLFGEGRWLFAITCIEGIFRLFYAVEYFLIGLAWRNFLKIK